MQPARIAWRLFQREWRSGEFTLLFAALIIAVTTATTVSFFTDRLGKAMLRQSAELIGGDLVLRSSRAISPDWQQVARDNLLEISELVEFTSVLVHEERILLASVKAADNAYPLRGKLRVADQLYGEGQAIEGSPPPGDVWIDSRVANKLDAEIGSSLALGAASFRVGKILVFEPDRGGDFFNLAPRVMMNISDLDVTQVIQPGSRVRYKQLYAGPETAISQMRDWLKPQLGPEHRILDVKTGRRGAGEALRKAEQYLGITALFAILLAAVAIAMASRRYSERHFNTSALLRCWGAGQAQLIKIYLYQLLALGVGAAVLGGLVGYLVHELLLTLLSSVMPAYLPQPSAFPLVVAFISGLVVLLGFGLPPLMRLVSVPPMRVLRKELLPLPAKRWLVYGAAAIAAGPLLYLMTADFGAAFAIMVSVLATVVIFSALLGRFLNWLKKRAQSSDLIRFMLRVLGRNSEIVGSQILAFALTLLAMAAVALLRTELLDTWEAQLPKDVPNFFAYNLLPEDKDKFEQQLSEQVKTDTPMYPIVRGRLVEINGEPVRTTVSKERASDNAVNRELNLTWATDLPADNSVMQGRWWQPEDNGQPRVSVESELAERLGIKLHDQLSFNIAGESVTVAVSSLRSVEWASFTPNFYMMFPPQTIERFPVTYITSFRLEQAQRPVLAKWVQDFPSVTLVEVDVIIEQLARVLRQVSVAVELLLVFVLLAGLAVLIASIRCTMDERLQEGALMRALGAKSKQLRMKQFSEFALIGLLSGLLAALGTEALLYFLYEKVFELDYSPNWQLWLLLPLLAGGTIGAVGYWVTRDVVRVRPLVLLNRA